MKRFYRLTALLAALLMVFCGAFALADEPVDPAEEEALLISALLPLQEEGTVCSDAVNIRQHPSTDAPAKMMVFAGDPVTISALVHTVEDQYWYQISAGGTRGYIFSELVNPADKNAVPSDAPLFPAGSLWLPDPLAVKALREHPAYVQYMADLGGIALIDGADILLPPMEMLVFNALTLQEQAVVMLHVLGYGEEADELIADQKITLSPVALDLIRVSGLRIGEMTDAERAQADADAKAMFPEYGMIIGGESRQYPLFRLAQEGITQPPCLGLYYENGGWRLIPYLQAE